MFKTQDRTLLRDLATRVAEIAARPVMAERRRQWVAHNSLRSRKPMLLAFPEGAWGEILPGSVIQCQDERARGIEWQLRARLYYVAHFADDTVIEKEWNVGRAIGHTGWGLEDKQHPSDAPRGAWAYDPVIKVPADLKKLRYPEVTYDEAASLRNYVKMQELFGDILDVKLRGITHISFHPMSYYARLRGLAEVMLDMAENPQMVHDAMAFYEEGYHRMVQQYERLNLLDLNNDSSYHSSGGNGYTDELPRPGFSPARVRTCDMWSSAEAQELAQVSPAMHRDFVLQYEKRLLARFGLNGYGCCEDLTQKLDDVFTIPNLRRISIAPWADVDRCAAKLKGNYIFSWKPNPAMMCGEFSPGAVRACIAHTLAAAKANGCVLEMILKDTHTCDQHPERFDEWFRIARELVDAG